jgi:hypothetical protein
MMSDFPSKARREKYLSSMAKMRADFEALQLMLPLCGRSGVNGSTLCSDSVEPGPSVHIPRKKSSPRSVK